MKLQRSVVAGSFYEGNAEALKAQIEACFLHGFGPGRLPVVDAAGPRRVLGLVSPHAGYPFSGPVAANGFSVLAADGVPDTVVVLGPNHRGVGSGLAVMREGAWQTPLGNVAIDGEVADALLLETHMLDVAESSPLQENSIEVQLPFLQYLYGERFRFVPIYFLMQDLESAKEIGWALAEVLANRNAVVIASSDFTHYESQATVNRKEAVEALDEQRFYEVLEAQDVSACGYAPIAALMTYAKGLGAKKAEVLSHHTSGEILGDFHSVVGYASVVVKK